MELWNFFWRLNISPPPSESKVVSRNWVEMGFFFFFSVRYHFKRDFSELLGPTGPAGTCLPAYIILSYVITGGHHHPFHCLRMSLLHPQKEKIPLAATSEWTGKKPMKEAAAGGPCISHQATVGSRGR